MTFPWWSVSSIFFVALANPVFLQQDLENDFAYSTNRVLSRIMQRLLVLLTQDRKIR